MTTKTSRKFQEAIFSYMNRRQELIDKYGIDMVKRAEYEDELKSRTIEKTQETMQEEI